MADDQNMSAGFKVVDRRSFSADGTRVSEEAQKEELRQAVEKDAAHSARRGVAAASKGLLAEDLKDFEMLISYLSTTAMFQLGLIAGPDGEHLPPDPETARQTIGFLEALQSKTRGNLTENEAKLLEEVIYELRMSCVEIEKRAVPKRK
jgi:Domain of unknown function (DUF1844)